MPTFPSSPSRDTSIPAPSGWRSSTRLMTAARTPRTGWPSDSATSPAKGSSLSSACSLLLRRDGRGQVDLRGESGNPNSDDNHSAKVIHGATTATLGLILNTTGSDWEVTYQVDGEDVGTRIFKTKPEIQFLGIGQTGTAEGRFIELKLTQTEP